MEQKLNIILVTERVLRVDTFESGTRGSSTVFAKIIGTESTPEEIYQMVIDFENENRQKTNSHRSRNVVFSYWVDQREIMTDDREKFGHENQVSEKDLGNFIPKTYVRGQKITIGEVLAKMGNGGFSENEEAGLSILISELDMDEKNLKEAELDTEIIMIDGEGRRERFFESISETTQVKIFPSEKLVQIKYPTAEEFRPI